MEQDFGETYRIAGDLFDALKLPIIITETSIITKTDSKEEDTPELDQAQVDYFNYLIANQPEFVFAWEWYCMNDNYWRNSSMVRWTEKQPVWYRFQDAASD